MRYNTHTHFMACKIPIISPWSQKVPNAFLFLSKPLCPVYRQTTSALPQSNFLLFRAHREVCEIRIDFNRSLHIVPLCFTLFLFFYAFSSLFSLLSFFFLMLISSPHSRLQGHLLSTSTRCISSSKKNLGDIGFPEIHQLGLCTTTVDRNYWRTVSYTR